MKYRESLHTMQDAAHVTGHTNPHALASIVKASESCQIVAHEDILDEHGVKLWSKNQPVSHALQQRLLERKLRHPLESCLRAEDGVTHVDLNQLATQLLAQHPLLSSGVGHWADALLEDIPHLPLHPVASLLLTATRASTPEAYDHAVMSMLLGGALALHAGEDRYQVRLHMLGGLLHDLGEMYIQPDYLRDGRPLAPEAWRHICVHPKVGEMLLQRQTDYPRELCRAVGEHHERGNGLGYPARARQLSPLGARLSAVETLMGVLASGRPAAWEHAALAVRLLPSEFDRAAASLASEAARRHQATAPMPTCPPADEIWARAQDHQRHIQAALQVVLTLTEEAPSAKVKAAAATITPILEELLRACDALGLWAPRHLAGEQLHELHLANLELAYRIETLQRTVCWLDGSWCPAESDALAQVWQALFGEALTEAA